MNASEINSTIQQLLSTIKQTRETYEASVSSIPVHPFDRLKREYLGENRQTVSFADLKCPENFCPFTAGQQLSSISQKIENVALTQIEALTSDSIKNECNAFASLSENVFVIDKEKAANYLQCINMINSIPLFEVENNPVETAKKVISYYIQMLR